MSKATHVQRPLFDPWVAWDQLPESVREQALDVLTAICLEITDVPPIGEQTTRDSSTAEATRPRSQKSSQKDNQSDDAHPH
jgi:hypothetical protein